MSLIRNYFLRQEDLLDSEFKGSSMEDHQGNTGDNREEIIRRWLEKHIPTKVTPEIGGKIIDAQGHLSEQVDIVIYDNSVPRFGSFPKKYFFAEGVNVAIQVKSTLTSGELASAVKNLSSVKECEQNFGGGYFHGNPNAGILTGIFAFDTGYSSSSAILSSLQKHEKAGVHPVNFIYINKKCYIAYNPGGWVKMDKTGKPLEELPKGYNIIENTQGCIWRLVLAIASETKRVVSSTPDFQKYFLLNADDPTQ